MDATSPSIEKTSTQSTSSILQLPGGRAEGEMGRRSLWWREVMGCCDVVGGKEGEEDEEKHHGDGDQEEERWRWRQRRQNQR
ncbi:hypothetical protein GW17_00037912 [Ensete ventricosum]|nr:hypothetical protein GW17_00037912 [Ensete ventricosum]RZS02443.1 hypothetical protein BHM03_00032513 [Ensete ventricosum]